MQNLALDTLFQGTKEFKIVKKSDESSENHYIKVQVQESAPEIDGLDVEVRGTQLTLFISLTAHSKTELNKAIKLNSAQWDYRTSEFYPVDEETGEESPTPILLKWIVAKK